MITFIQCSGVNEDNLPQAFIPEQRVSIHYYYRTSSHVLPPRIDVGLSNGCAGTAPKFQLEGCVYPNEVFNTADSWLWGYVVGGEASMLGQYLGVFPAILLRHGMRFA